MQEILEEQKPEYIISGMAIGVDTVFAIAGLQLEIPLDAQFLVLIKNRCGQKKQKNYIIRF